MSQVADKFSLIRAQFFSELFHNLFLYTLHSGSLHGGIFCRITKFDSPSTLRRKAIKVDDHLRKSLQ